MKDLYNCRVCGFISTRGDQFVNDGNGFYLCTDCAEDAKLIWQRDEEDLPHESTIPSAEERAAWQQLK